MKGYVLTVMLVAVVLGLSPVARAQSANVRSAIEAQGQKWDAALKKGDAAAMAALYTTDAEAFPPNADVARGRDAIQKLFQSFLDGGVAASKLTTREVGSAGDTAWETGTYEMSGKDGKPVDQGKYVVVWKRVQGQWLLHRDIWNSNLAAK
jgi:uncharacterized protein (TIGR02246 family)